MIRTIRKAAILKFVSWVIFSPTLAMAADNLHVANSPQLTRLYDKASVTFLSDKDKQEFSYTIDRNGIVSGITTSPRLGSKHSHHRPRHRGSGTYSPSWHFPYAVSGRPRSGQ